MMMRLYRVGWLWLMNHYFMRNRILGVFPLPAPVCQGHGEQRAPEQDVGEWDCEEYPHFAGSVPPHPPSDVRDQPGSAVSTLSSWFDCRYLGELRFHYNWSLSQLMYWYLYTLVAELFVKSVKLFDDEKHAENIDHDPQNIENIMTIGTLNNNQIKDCLKAML